MEGNRYYKNKFRGRGKPHNAETSRSNYPLRRERYDDPTHQPPMNFTRPNWKHQHERKHYSHHSGPYSRSLPARGQRYNAGIQLRHTSGRYHEPRPEYDQSFGQTSNILRSTSPEQFIPRVKTELEIKIDKLINAVQSQNGIRGDLVLMETNSENSMVILQNALQNIKNAIQINFLGQLYQLLISGEPFGEGNFSSKQIAKQSLCEAAVQELRKSCFYLKKKRNYEEIKTDDLTKTNKDVPSQSSMEGSKAHMMMLKMGWGGKGLGTKEQGVEAPVSDSLTQNITREGLGGKNVMQEVHKMLEEFARSIKVTTLAFDSSFTKEERAQIHKIAQKFNLKSKSEGKDSDRRITISKKLKKWELVRELLMVDCENDSYKLIVPSNFENMWAESTD